MKAIACSKAVPLGARCPAPPAHAGGQQCANLIPPKDAAEPKARRAVFATLLCDRCQRSFGECIRQVHVTQMALNRSSVEAGLFRFRLGSLLLVQDVG